MESPAGKRVLLTSNGDAISRNIAFHLVKCGCRVVKCAGQRGHILNLGHGVLVGTPEEAVSHFFDVARSLKYDLVSADGVAKKYESVV